MLRIRIVFAGALAAIAVALAVNARAPRKQATRPASL